LFQSEISRYYLLSQIDERILKHPHEVARIIIAWALKNKEDERIMGLIDSLRKSAMHLDLSRT
jgi:hypothetical protein